MNRQQQHFHLQAPPGSWLNDPCVVVVGEKDNRLHVFYQFSPGHTKWTAPILWAHSSTIDGLHWRHHGIALEPSIESDRQSVFTGIGVVWNGYRGHPTAFYTGVTRLPIDWKLPYQPGAETQNLIYTTDDFQSWHRHPQNPVLSYPPKEWQVVGWRDPFVFQDQRLSRMLQSASSSTLDKHNQQPSNDGYFMLVSGGISGLGGALFLYHSNDLVSWQPMPLPLLTVDAYSSSPNDGFMSFNFEVAYFRAVVSAKENLYLLTVGAEGKASWLQDDHATWWALGQVNCRGRSPSGPDRLPWLTTEGPGMHMNCTPMFEVLSSGLFDYGLLYAVSPVMLAVVGKSGGDDRNRFLGWANEDLISGNDEDNLISAAGSMGFPREAEVIRPSSGVPYLAVRPARELLSHLHRSAYRQLRRGRRQLMQQSQEKPLLIADSNHFAMRIKMLPTVGSVNFTLLHSLTESTTIRIYAGERKVIIDRQQSSQHPDANRKPLIMRWPSEPAGTGIQLDLLMDGSLLELFVNYQASLTTRIYPIGNSHSSGSGAVYMVIETSCMNPVQSVESWYQFSSQAFHDTGGLFIGSHYFVSGLFFIAFGCLFLSRVIRKYYKQ